ncbi:B12-binding domain-containing radical SAM protein [bacterium]|nr:B12-binding domain-containing radical SAM protein [bacterium]
MSRVLLLSYPGYPSTPAQLVANPWLAHLAGALLEAGHEPLALDFGTVSMMRRLFPEALTAQLKGIVGGMNVAAGLDEKALAVLTDLSARLEAHQAQVEQELVAEVVAAVEGFAPQVVVLELGDGDGFTGTLQMAAALRERFPDLIIAASGRKAAWFRGRVLRAAPQFTAIIHGDPEDAVYDLAEVAAGKMSLPEVTGISYQDGASAIEAERADYALGDLPVPVYAADVYPAMAGDEKIKMGIITESRGCANRCAFCLHPYEDGDHQRLAPAARVVDTMAELQERYGMGVFRLCGASTPGELLRDIAREILQRGLKVQYNSFGHFRNARPEDFATLAQSGLYSLFFGLESGSQEILNRAVHKGIRLERVRENIAACKAAGIFTAASMIVPLPFDTPETLAESLTFVTEVKPDAVPLQFPGLMPGTRWAQEPDKYNIEIEDVEAYLTAFMDYRIKLLFPPPFWTPLPYKVNGMGFQELTGVTMRFAGQLEQAGILTNLSHTLAAIAQSAGMPSRQLRDAAQLWFVTGDAEAVGRMVARANASMIVR